MFEIFFWSLLLLLLDSNWWHGGNITTQHIILKIHHPRPIHLLHLISWIAEEGQIFVSWLMVMQKMMELVIEMVGMIVVNHGTSVDLSPYQSLVEMIMIMVLAFVFAPKREVMIGKVWVLCHHHLVLRFVLF
jgi:hypothetical protein